MGGILSVSNEHSTIGETSIKSVKNAENKCSVDCVYLVKSSDIGKSISATFNNYCTSNCIIMFYYRKTNAGGSATILTEISYPANSTTPITLSLDEIVEGTYSVVFRVTSSSDPIYIDNIQFQIQ